MGLGDDFKKVLAKQDKVVAEIATDLFSELVEITPVKTGQLKIAWDIARSKDGWVISNNMQYASIIFDGRLFVQNKFQGSEQLPNGIDPILRKYELLLSQKLDAI